MTENNFFLNDTGVIEIITTGDRTASLVQSSAQKIFAFAKQLRAAGKPVLILNDISAMGEVPLEAHKIFADIAHEADYDRFALLGADNIVRLGANLIAQSIGKPDSLKYFDDRDQALAWLAAFVPAK
jgi:UDP-N-acetylmuramyl pentapeptide synthase